jgi:hypothetical protein
MLRTVPGFRVQPGHEAGQGGRKNTSQIVKCKLQKPKWGRGVEALTKNTGTLSVQTCDASQK